jgi:uncharacterized repeat protein (TIGR01451 family)
MTNIMIRLRKAALPLLGGLLLISAPALAQPTEEGTVITNQAQVSWTDANSNTYTPVSASVDVTVGFADGVDVTGPGTAAPNPGSNGNTLAYVITNTGNGDDSVSVAETISTAGITVTGYDLDGAPYGTLALLNDALAATLITFGNSVTVTVTYDVAADQGGVLTNYTLTADSRRGPAQDAQLTAITPGLTAGVTVTPDAASVDRLPSPPNYTETFTVVNNGDGRDTFDLGASSDPAKITIVSVNGVAGASTSVAFTAGESIDIDVVYTVIAAAGASDVLQLLATSQADGGITDTGDVTVNVIAGADLAIAKAAFRDDQSTPIAGTVVPGEFIWYRITVTNNGDTDATSVVVTDTLPIEVTYDSDADDGGAPAWSITTPAADEVEATLATLAFGTSRFFWIRVQIK